MMLASACSLPDGDEEAVRWLDYEQFAVDVQPILAEHCGNPSCHGRPDRAFSLYSHRNWRVDPDELFLPSPLTSDELAHNYTSACVQSSETDNPEDTMLLLKPLGDVSGTYHGGGTLFADTTDRSYRIVLNWLESGWND